MILCLVGILLFASTAVAAPMTNNSITSVTALNTGAFGANTVPDGISPTTGLESEKPYHVMLITVGKKGEYVFTLFLYLNRNPCFPIKYNVFCYSYQGELGTAGKLM